jgi:hypothetical protein
LGKYHKRQPERQAAATEKEAARVKENEGFNRGKIIWAFPLILCIIRDT